MFKELSYLKLSIQIIYVKKMYISIVPIYLKTPHLNSLSLDRII